MLISSTTLPSASEFQHPSSFSELAFTRILLELEQIAREAGHTEECMLLCSGLELYRGSNDAVIALRIGRVVNQFVSRPGKALREVAMLATEQLGPGYSYSTLANLSRLSELFTEAEVEGIQLAHLKCLINGRMPNEVRQAGLAAARGGASTEAICKLVRDEKRRLRW